MSSPLALSILISLTALIVADEQSSIGRGVLKKFLTFPNEASVRNRLTKIGKPSEESFENFRIFQLATIGITILISALLTVIGILGSRLFLFLLIVIPPSAILLTDRNLTARCKRRKMEIESEFPSVVEILTLAVAAGESPIASIKRISERAKGHLAEQFAQVVFEVEHGSTLISALDRMSRNLESETIRRFVDSLIISISRGTSLVETLSHGVDESKSNERAVLMTAAGRSEISMMIPVVFLILPVSILFALYPSMSSLNLFSN